MIPLDLRLGVCQGRYAPATVRRHASGLMPEKPAAKHDAEKGMLVMLEVAHIEAKAGAASGLSLTSDETNMFWSAPTVGGALELRRGAVPKSRFGLALWYQLNTYDGKSSDPDYYPSSGPEPKAHLVAAVLYWGHAFTLKGGSEHGPRVGLGGLAGFGAKDSGAYVPPWRQAFQGGFVEGSYHGALALPHSALSLTAEGAWMLGMNVVGGNIEPTMQFRVTLGALWRFDS